MPTSLKGLATGIGSLPHKDVHAALDLVFEYTAQVPFWPQLPKRDIREGMVIQYTQNLPIPQPVGGLPAFQPFAHRSSEEILEIFYEKIINKDVDYFKIDRDYAAGLYAFKERLEKEQGLLGNIQFIKCQITGPFTFAASIKDENGTAYLHNPIYMQAVSKGLVMKALWQIGFFKEFHKKIIIFIDEPYLGCFGSAYTPLEREEVVKGLTELAEGIKTPEVILGVHCCGNTDWSIFTEIKSIEIISFDAFSFLEKFIIYAENLKGFLQRGGIICWGLVPTQETSGKEEAQALVDKLKNAVLLLEKKGLDRDLVTKKLWISPSCGLGALDTIKAKEIFSLLEETSNLLKKSL